MTTPAAPQPPTSATGAAVASAPLADAASTSAFPGASEMAGRCRALDWAATPLGPVAGWPAALRTAARLCLDAGFPTCLYAGDELVLVYNDGFAEILGGKHPDVLGRAAAAALPEIWAEIAPDFARVRATGAPVFRRDARYVLARGPGGAGVEGFYTFAFSPVRDDGGAVLGVLSVVTETTARVRAEAALRANEAALAAERDRLRQAFDQAPGFVAVLRGPDHRYEYANGPYAQIAAHRPLLGRTVREALPELAGQGFYELLDRVYATGEPFGGHALPIQLQPALGGPLEDRRIDLIYQPLTEPRSDGMAQVTGILVQGRDVTEAARDAEGLAAANAELRDQQVELELANQQLQENAAELEAQTEELQATAAHLEEQVAAADAARARAAGILEAMADAYFALDAGFRLVAVNAAMERSVGVPRDQLLGRSMWEAFPGTVGNVFERAYRRAAAERAEAHFTHDYSDGRLALVTDVDVYPGPDGGVAVFWRDVTARVCTEAALAAGDARYRALLASVDTGFCLVEVLVDAHGDVADFRFLETNATFERQSGLADVVGRRMRELAPGHESHWFATFGRVAVTGEPVRFENHAAALGRWFEVFAYRVDAPEQRRVAILFTDVTAAKAAEGERERLLAETEAARAAADAERARLAGVLAAMSDAHIAMDREWRVVSLNPAAERFNGRPAAHFLGRTHWEAWPESVGSDIERHYRRAMATREAVHFETHYAEAGVLNAWVEVDAVPTPDGGLGLFFRDVTARHRAEAERERLLAAERAERANADAARARAEAVLASISDPFWMVDREWRFTHLNAAGEPLLQTTREALVGRTVWEAFPEVVGSVFEVAYREAMTEGHPTSVEAYFPPLDTWFDVRVYPWAGGLMAQFHDTTARHAAEAEREQLLAAERAARAEAEAERARAADANQAKSQFLATMSHELRTPLNAIGGYAELIELGVRGPVTEPQRSDLARIQRAQRHLLGLINGVLNYARVEAGAVHYAVEDVPLDEVLAACEALVAPQVRAKGLTLRHDACDGAMRVRADREKLQQVVLNLLSNAVKFTEPGGRVALRCDVAGDVAGGGLARVQVADTGIGIAADQLAHVFEPFVQVDARLTRTQEGTGLGLAISRDLARGMGGDLTAESTPGVGSTFTLTLPAA